MSTCRCGSSLAPAGQHCPVCQELVVDETALLEELHESFRKTTWTPPEKLTKPTPPKRFTRWSATVFTFGPRVKVTLTIVVVSVMVQTILWTHPWLFFKNSGRGQFVKPFLLFDLLVTLVGGSFFLRALWRKARSE